MIAIGEVETMKALLRLRPRWRVPWTPRDGNGLAHNLAKWGRGLDCRGDVPVGDVPSEIITCDDSAFCSREVV